MKLTEMFGVKEQQTFGFRGMCGVFKIQNNTLMVTHHITACDNEKIVWGKCDWSLNKIAEILNNTNCVITEPEFADFDKELARHFNKKVKYLARNENGVLVGFESKPIKNSTEDDMCGVWSTTVRHGFWTLNALHDVFNDITWKDKEATLVSDVINS